MLFIINNYYINIMSKQQVHKKTLSMSSDTMSTSSNTEEDTQISTDNGQLIFTENDKNKSKSDILLPISKVTGKPKRKYVRKNKSVFKKNKNTKNISKNAELDEIIKSQLASTKDVKNIMMNNKIIREKIETVERIFELYPNLKKNKKTIINYVLDKKQSEQEEHILEMINFNNRDIYIDKFGNIINDQLKLIGFYIIDQQTHKNKYLIFDDIKKLTSKIQI